MLYQYTISCSVYSKYLIHYYFFAVDKNVINKPLLMSRSGSRKQGSAKWVKNIRGLASNPQDNDYLKVDYIDVNLNNSRKLIVNLNNLTNKSDEHVLKNHELNESLIRLEAAQSKLSWLNKLDTKSSSSNNS